MQQPGQGGDVLSNIKASLKQLYATIETAIKQQGAPQEQPAQQPQPPAQAPVQPNPASAPAKPGAAYTASPAKETDPMTDPKTNPEQLSDKISPEEFAALKAKAAKVDELQTQMTAMAGNFAAEKRDRRRDQLKARCQRFTAIAVKPDELAEKFQTLEEKDPELFKYFDGLLESLDTAIVQSGLFNQIASIRAGEGQGETYEVFADKVWKEEFKGDPEKIQAAYEAAADRRPDLFEAYSDTYSPAKTRKSRGAAN